MANQPGQVPFTPPPPKPAGKGFFASKPKPAPIVDSGLRNDVTVVNTRLRVTEERYNDLRRKLHVIEENMLSHHKKVIAENKVLKSDLLSMKRQIRQVEDKMVMLIKELQLTARKEDVDVMRRYVELWNPVRFVSAEQVEKIVDERMNDHHEEMHEE
jgi:hypothetical protein